MDSCSNGTKPELSLEITADITATAEMRELIPNLARSFDQRVTTVPGLISSSRAISLSVSPSPARMINWVSRGESMRKPRMLVRPETSSTVSITPTLCAGSAALFDHDLIAQLNNRQPVNPGELYI